MLWAVRLYQYGVGDDKVQNVCNAKVIYNYQCNAYDESKLTWLAVKGAEQYGVYRSYPRRVNMQKIAAG